MLARELLKIPDSFITATIDDREYIIEDYKRKFSIANTDDSVGYISLNLRKDCCGNIKR